MAFCEETHTHDVLITAFLEAEKRRTCPCLPNGLVLERWSACDERSGTQESETFIARSQLVGSPPCLRWPSILWLAKGAQHSRILLKVCRKTRTHVCALQSFREQRRGTWTLSISHFENDEEGCKEEERHMGRRRFYVSLAMSQEVVMWFLMLLFVSSRGRTAYNEIATVLW